MKFKITHKILFGLAVAVFIFLSPIASFAEPVTYTYDATNRLIQVNETGTAIEYEYDNVGNLQQRIRLDSVTSDPSSKYFGFVNIGSTSPAQSFTITNSVKLLALSL